MLYKRKSAELRKKEEVSESLSGERERGSLIERIVAVIVLINVILSRFRVNTRIESEEKPRFGFFEFSRI